MAETKNRFDGLDGVDEEKMKKPSKKMGHTPPPSPKAHQNPASSRLQSKKRGFRCIETERGKEKQKANLTN